MALPAIHFANAQRGFPGFEPGGQSPPATYYSGVEVYRTGDVVSALELFDLTISQGRRTPQGLWLDSIPALAMRAECLYQIGDCVGAAEAIEAVMAISNSNSRWLTRVVWDTFSQPGVVRADRQYLWPAAAAVNVITANRSTQFQSGVVVSEQTLLQGGVIEPFNIKVIDITEVMRGIATALHRRRILMGPLATDDPVAIAMLASIKFPASGVTPFGRANIESMRGCGYFAAGDDDRTVSAISGATFDGSVHDLSPVTLVSALHSASLADDVSDKVTAAIQSANIAAALEQIEWIGPSLKMAASYSNPQNAAEVGNLAASIARALPRRFRLGSFHAAVAAADAYVTAGQLDLAANMLVSANEISSRRDVYCPRIDAYAAWVAARLAAANSSGANGGTFGGASRTSPSVTAVMLDPAISLPLQRLNAFASGDLPAVGRNRRNRSATLITLPRVFQQLRLPALLSTGANSSTAGLIASVYIGDAPRWLWRTDPVDALGSAGYDSTPLHRVRINLAIASGNAEDIWRASNDYGVDRFLSRMPIGGRAASVRKMAWADLEQLDRASIDFIESTPAMKAIRTEVIRSGRDPAAAPTLRAAANRIALTADHIPQGVLPELDPKDPLEGFPEQTAVLSMVEVDQAFQFVMMSGKRLRQWRIPSAVIKKTMSAYLLASGMINSKARISANEKEVQGQRTSQLRLTKLLFPDDAIWQSVDELRLTIIPDGVLWYLPFETLLAELPDETSNVTLGDRFLVNYAPTIGSLRFPAGPEATNKSVAFAADNFFVPRDAQRNDEVAQRLAAIPGVDAEILKTTPSSQIGTVAQHAVFASARGVNAADPLSMVPSPVGPATADTMLASWMSFPHDPPSSVFMAGVRSGLANGGDGSEIFMILCGLRTAGVRDAIISRWAVGGESTASLIEEYLQEVALSNPTIALTRAKTLLRQKEIIPAAEPLLGRLQSGREDITGNEPLFWSGYLLCR